MNANDHGYRRAVLEDVREIAKHFPALHIPDSELIDAEEKAYAASSNWEDYTYRLALRVSNIAYRKKDI